MKKTLGGLADAIGSTPLVRLSKLYPDFRGEIYAKLEFTNPGGSMKDRPAFNMIEKQVYTGHLKRGDVVVESSSGNMGIGLAQACQYFGLGFICITDQRTNMQTIEVLRSLGAKVIIIHENDVPPGGSLLESRLDRVQNLIEKNPKYYWPNQYGNPHNPEAYQAMMREIELQLGEPFDYIICATGTCGTIRGCSDYIKERGLTTKVVAVDAIGSAIFGQEPARRLIPGHGSSRRPDLYRSDMFDDVEFADDRDCVIGCRKLLHDEGIFAGGSTGAIVSALEVLTTRIKPGSKIVIIIPDRGERYVDTIYNDHWVNKYINPLTKER